jgi:sugar phosphate isomerase/epimerase
LFQHYEKVAKLCNSLGITKIVFGSPKARHLGKLPEEYAINLFRKIGTIGQKYNAVCCLEPNATEYGCTWLTNISDTVDFINKVNHMFVKINYDVGNYLMENDTFTWSDENIGLIGHVQISNRFLKSITYLSDAEKLQYTKQIKSIMDLGYSDSISMEMLESDIYDLINSIYIFLNLHL